MNTQSAIAIASVDDPHGVRLRLSAQRALLGNVPGSLRSASVEYRGHWICCRFIFDAEPSDDDRELLSCAASEIIADFDAPYMIDDEYLTVPEPDNMQPLQYRVYERYEPQLATED